MPRRSHELQPSVHEPLYTSAVPAVDNSPPSVPSAEALRRRRGLLVVGSTLVLAVGVALGLYFWWPFGGQGQRLRLPGVVESQEIRLASKVGGRVAAVEVQEGDQVRPNQVLVRFEVPELQAQRAQQAARVQAAQAALLRAINGPRPQEKRAAQAAVQAARARLEKLKAGWRQEEKEQARSDMHMAEADLKLTRDEFERVQKLYRQASVARAEFDAALAAYDKARGRAAAAKARLDMLLSGSRPEDIAEAQALLAQAEAQADLLEAGTRPEEIALAKAQLHEAQAKLDELDAHLQEAVLRAPGLAVVEVLAVRPGDVVQPHQPVVRVLRTDDLWVKVYVPETELGKLRLGQAAEVYLDAYPSRPFEGTVYHIASESEFTPRNVQSPDERRHQVFGVRIRVPQPADPSQRVFKAGLAAEVLLPLHEAPSPPPRAAEPSNR